MNKWVICFALLPLTLSASVWAGTYSIDMDMQVDNAKSVHQLLKANEGELSSFTIGENTIKILTTAAANGAVKIQALIYRQVGTELKLLSNPEIVSALNQPAEISRHDLDGKNLLKLKLITHPPTKTSKN